MSTTERIDKNRNIAFGGIRAAMIAAGHTCWLTSWEEARDGKIFHCHDGVEEEITPEKFGEFVANTI
jgi:hypothetical protein